MKKFFSIILIAVLSLGVAKAQTVLFSEDFHAGINPAWSNSGTSAGTTNPFCVWRYTHSGSHGAYDQYPDQDTIISPTAYNGWIIFDSDSLDNGGVPGAFGQGPAPAPQTVALTTTAINVSGYPYCMLNFNQYYRDYESTTIIGISIDNVNWTYDTINTTIGTNVATPQNSQVAVDLSPVINSVSPPADSVYISFMMNANYYFWQIDDINVISLPNNNLSILSANGVYGTTGLFYSTFPASQADSFYATTTYRNIGRDPQPNTVATMNLIDGGSQIATYTTNPPVALLPYATDTNDNTIFYTQGIGSYLVAVHVSSDSVNYSNTDNYDTFGFAVTDTVYSISNSKYVSNDYFLVRNAYGLDAQYGALYEITNTDTVTSITTAMAGGSDGTHAGAIIEGYIYPVTISSGNLLYTNSVVNTVPKTLTAGDLTTGATIQTITLPISNSSGSSILAPGLYFVGIGGTPAPGDSIILMPTTTYATNAFPAGPAYDQTTGQPIAGQLGYFSTTDAPFANLNLGHAVTLLYVQWTKNPNTNPVYANRTITFTGISNASANAVYTWVMTGKNTGTVYNATGKVIHQIFTVADTFNVCLTVTDGSNSVEDCNNVNVAWATGIDDISALDNVTMVPNPSTGMVTISSTDINGPVSISIVNLLGETVENYNGTSNGAFSKTFNLSDLSNGIYLVKISNGDNSVTKKLSISK